VTSLSSRAVARRYFGRDGVRGFVGDVITPDLVERLGRAATIWSGRGRVFVGRDTRGSGPELEEAFAAGVVSAGGSVVLAGVLPSPAVALLALDLGVVISASHNPPEFNGVKFFDRDGQKLSDEAEEEIESLLDAPPTGGGELDRIDVATDSYLEHVVERFGSYLSGLRIGVDCANGAYSGLAPKAFEDLGAEVVAIGDEPDGTNINLGCGATDLRALQETVVRHGLDLGVDLVAVTTMTNLGFHRLMAEHGIRVVTTDVGDRYVLEALRREGGILGGEQSGHIVYLRDHVTGDGLASALLLCRALEGRPLAEAAAVMPKYPQVKENFAARGRKPSEELLAEVERVNAELGDRGRVLVRRSGTESVIRVLAEAETQAEAEELSARIGALVRRELG